jgi:hypothetical protein
MMMKMKVYFKLMHPIEMIILQINNMLEIQNQQSPGEGSIMDIFVPHRNDDVLQHANEEVAVARESQRSWLDGLILQVDSEIVCG